jgi:hypothetical protein
VRGLYTKSGMLINPDCGRLGKARHRDSSVWRTGAVEEQTWAPHQQEGCLEIRGMAIACGE